MNKKKSFVLYVDMLSVLDEMDDKQAGKLFKAIRAYWLRNAERCQQDAGTGYDELVKDFVTRLAIAPFIAQFEKDCIKYNAMVERNRANGRKGGAPKSNKNAERKQPTGLKTTQNNRKQPSGLSGLFCEDGAPIEEHITPQEINELSKTTQNNRVGCFDTDENSPSNIIYNINNINNNSKKIIKDNLKEKGEISGGLFPPPPPVKRKRVKVKFQAPTLDEVKAYFLSQGADVKIADWEKEASIFFNHYDSIGWKTPNGAQIVNWDSKANVWILDKENNATNKRNYDKHGIKARLPNDPDCGLIE